MMDDLAGKAAVVTGAASGIGYALAEALGHEGMRVVMADVEEQPLTEAAAKVRSVTGSDVLGVPTDVSVAASVDDLAVQAIEAYGPVALLCNNAGVAGGGLVWDTPLSEWEWVLGVNLWGVVHGLHTFLPAMVAQGEGHIVNTASMAGLLASPGMAPYCASKHAVVAISEALYRELELAGSPLGVSVLCPGFVNTRIVDADRNWPSRLGPVPEQGEVATMVDQFFRQQILAGMPPATVAEHVVAAIKQRRFWVLTHAEQYADHVRSRFDAAVSGRDPDPFAFG
jgi:NAD(P)-dependent dehydrogenase (short-subunit alcohol dehydrogenase family)